MTQEDIIRMAREAGLHLATDVNWMPIIGIEYAERFAALVLAAERNKLAAWMIAQGYATGHGDTMEGLLEELRWQVRESEPVAWGVFDGPNLHDMFFTEEEAQDMARLKGDGSVVRPLTTPPAAQRQWVGLTKTDINEIWKGEPMLLPWDMTRTLAIEQRLKEKNNG